ncbi:MAG: PEP-CTERM sorting domain-containing protein [Verrucomicrobiales bacterium]|jgi:autotransporter-associated beta strand protein|nr:PEP-CTERM sorting domain-containing protein [Verrucomicrobiales bacterium]
MAAATSTVLAQQWSGTLTFNNASGDNTWSGVNWLNNGTNSSYINDAPVTFSASFNSTTKTIAPLDSTPLYYGQVINANTSLLQYGNNSINTQISTGTYNFLNNWTIGTGTGTAIATSGIIALFNNYTGNVTVSGAQYLNELRFAGGGNVLLNSTSGTFFFSPGPNNGTAITVSDNTSAEIKVDLDNRHITTANNLLSLRNNGSGTLAFNGNTIHATGGIRFENSSGSNLTTLNNVTLDNNTANMNFQLGTFTFSGSNKSVSTGQVILGAGGSTTLNVNVNALLDFTNSSYFVVGKGGNASATSRVNIQGELRTGNSDVTIADTTANNAIVTLSGTGKLTVNSSRSIYVGISDAGTGQLLVGTNSADTASVTAQKILVSYKGGSGYLDVQGSSTVALQGGNGSLSISGSNGYGEANFRDNSILTTAYLLIASDGASATGTGVFNLSGNAKATASTSFSVAGSGTGLGIVNLRNNSQLTLTGNTSVALGKTGTAILNVYDQASLKLSGGDFKIGETGGAGSATLNVYSGTVQGTDPAHGYLCINQNNNVNGSSGIVNLSGGTIMVSNIVFGSNATTSGTNHAYLNITGGELVLTSANGLHTGIWSSSGTEANSAHTASDTQINLGGGKITTTNGLTTAMNMTLTGSNGNIKFNATDGSSAKTITLGGNLSGNGGLEVTAGTLLLKGVNTYKGQTVVDAGSSFTLDSAGSLTISLATLEANGNLAAFSGDGYLTLTGKVNIDFTGATGTEWSLIDTSLISIVSDNWLTGFTKDSDTIWTKDNYTFDLDTGLLTMAIPEPSTWLLLGIGASLLVVFRGRRLT